MTEGSVHRPPQAFYLEERASMAPRRSPVRARLAPYNANIPVLRDADQIVVLDSRDRGGELKTRARSTSAMFAMLRS
jgi:hypothetical protein